MMSGFVPEQSGWFWLGGDPRLPYNGGLDRRMGRRDATRAPNQPGVDYGLRAASWAARRTGLRNGEILPKQWVDLRGRDA